MQETKYFSFKVVKFKKKFWACNSNGNLRGHSILQDNSKLACSLKYVNECWRSIQERHLDTWIYFGLINIYAT